MIHLESSVKVRVSVWIHITSLAHGCQRHALQHGTDMWHPCSDIHATPVQHPCNIHATNTYLVVNIAQVKDREIGRLFKVLDSAKEAEFETTSQKLQV